MALCSNICLNGGIDGRCETGMGGIIEVAISNWATNLFTKHSEGENPETPGANGPVSYVTADTAGGTCGTVSAWYKFTFRRNTGNMTSTLNIDDTAGVSFVQTDLQLIFGRMDQAKRLEIVSLTQAPCAIVVKDSNNNYWALGVDEPVTASAGEGVTGTNRTDSNHYSVTLTDISETFPLPVQNGAAILSAAEF